MRRPSWRTALLPAAERAVAFLESLPERKVSPRKNAREMLAVLGGPLPEGPTDAGRVVAELADDADPGITAMPGGRFFGWVIGGGHPSAVAADWLTSAWDQNAGSHEGTPAAAAAEQIALEWVIELLHLPRGSSAALVTGAQMANTVGLAAARNALLHDVGWDVEARGLFGAPPVHLVWGEERHDTVPRSARLLGFGASTAWVANADEHGAMRSDALSRMVNAIEGPAVICAQAGNVNTGAIDPLDRIADIVEQRRASGQPTWLHVDGAFGLWARASRTLSHLVQGAERADSWATDGHKWPNVPYDCGIAIVAHPDAHRRSMAIHASYLPESNEAELRNPFDFTPELSRRARGFALYATLKELGRSGVEDLIDRSCAHARRFREELEKVDRKSVV